LRVVKRSSRGSSLAGNAKLFFKQSNKGKTKLNADLPFTIEPTANRKIEQGVTDEARTDEKSWSVVDLSLI